MAASRPDPLLGKEVARCRLDEVLGGGASAVVYRGWHLGLGLPVAVKVLRPRAARRPEVVESFRREARAIARLDHENVLKVYDVVDEGALHCMVMELLEGESVLDLVTKRERLSVIDSLRIIRQAALGLAAAHAQGIVHRDVKPENLVVLPDGTVKLVDFGLAVDEMAAGTRVGTPHYMAPETCRTGHAEAASDMYSLGVTFFHLLVGQPPFAGLSKEGILRAHRDGAPMDLEERRPGLVRPVVRLFDWMTTRDPAVRPTANEAVAELDRIGGKRLLRTRPLRPRARHPALLPAAVTLVLVLGAALFLLRGRGGEASGTRETPPPRAQAPPPAPEPEPASAPPAPDPEEVAREAAEAKRLEQEAQRLLEGVETWARANWRQRTDTAAVLGRYRAISGPYRKTRAAREAANRVAEIEAGTRHPHPDRRWATPEEIEAARAAFDSGREVVAGLVARHRYRDAQAALPPRISDPEGTLEAELDAEHAYLDALVAFPAALAARLEAAPHVSHAVKTARGEGEVTAVHEAWIEVRLEGEVVRLPWEQVETRSLARLGIRAFDRAPGHQVIPLLAFCVAHGLESEFWEASLGVDLAGRPAEEEALVRALGERLSGR